MRLFILHSYTSLPASPLLVLTSPLSDLVFRCQRSNKFYIYIFFIMIIMKLLKVYIIRFVSFNIFLFQLLFLVSFAKFSLKRKTCHNFINDFQVNELLHTNSLLRLLTKYTYSQKHSYIIPPSLSLSQLC